MDSTEKPTPTPEAPLSTDPTPASAPPEIEPSPVADGPVYVYTAPSEPATPPAMVPVTPTEPPPPNAFQKMLDGMRNWIIANPRRSGVLVGVLLLLILSFIIRVDRPHVALSGEPLLPGGWLTNSFLTTLVVDVILLVVAFVTGANMKLVPSGLQNVMEAIIEYLYSLAESVAGRAASTYFPWAATLFLFLLLSNYTGLIPGVGSIGFYHSEESHASRLDGQLAMANGKLLLQEGNAAEEHNEAAAGEHAKFVPLFRAPSADLNLTFALALATMVMVQYYGIRSLGGSYFHKFWNTSGSGFMKGINIFTGILETISEIARILSFSFRLFGNIFAGEVVLATMAFLITFLLPVPFYGLELLVGAIQALVFAMLALVFFSMATISHGGEHHEEHAEAGH
jgi:F-type H+-transporting ATPase subunit a